jgi:hypothetical protein
MMQKKITIKSLLSMILQQVKKMLFTNQATVKVGGVFSDLVFANGQNNVVFVFAVAF